MGRRVPEFPFVVVIDLALVTPCPPADKADHRQEANHDNKAIHNRSPRNCSTPIHTADTATVAREPHLFSLPGGHADQQIADEKARDVE